MHIQWLTTRYALFLFVKNIILFNRWGGEKMRSVVVDMQNLLFADVVAEALRHFNFEFKPVLRFFHLSVRGHRRFVRRTGVME